jgi:CHAT domain-containing protein
MKAKISYLCSILLLGNPYWGTAQSEADSLLDRSVELVLENKEGPASDFFEKALDIFQSCDSLSNWIEAHKAFGKAYRTRKEEKNPGKTVEILQSATEAKLWRQPVSVQEWEKLVWLHVNIAFTEYYKLENFKKAIQHYERANEIHIQYIGALDGLMIKYVYKPLANLYTRLGESAAAAVYLEKSLDYFLVHNDMENAAKVSSDLAMSRLFAGQVLEAEAMLTSAMGYEGISTDTEVLLSANLGKVLHDLGKNDAAEVSISRSIHLLRKSLEKEDALYKWKWLGSLYTMKGDVLLSRKSYGQAEKVLTEAEDILTRVSGSYQNRDLAGVYQIFGKLYHEQKNYEKAIRSYHKILNVLLENDIDYSWRALPDASEFFAEYMLIDALDGKAEALNDWYTEKRDPELLEVALECHELIYEVEQLQRRSYRYESSKLFNVADARRRSTHAIQLALKLHEVTQKTSYKETAFSFAERSKSILMLEAFHNSRAVSLAGLPDSILEKEAQLQQAIATIEENLYSLQKTEEEASRQQLKIDLLKLKQDYTDWIGELEIQYPRYYKLKYNFNTRSASEIQHSLLDETQAFVEYFVGEEKVYVFLITSRQFEILEFSKDVPLEDWIIELHEHIEAFQFSSSDRSALCTAYSQRALQLYDYLIKPLEKYTLPEKLIIVPDGILGLVPFDALITSTPQGGCNFSSYPYLINRFDIHYAYSATLQSVLAERPAYNREMAGFAPAFDGSGGFGKLTHNRALLEELRQELGSNIYLDQQATVKALNEIAADYGILHFATHAQANTEAGNFSFIVFSDGAGGYDSLFVKDIYLLPLQAEMAVLSACETAVGKLYQGEGIINLARSFLYAGANSVITTQWSINDAANKELMAAFYHQLKKGHSKSEALRMAKLQQIQRGGKLNAHPVYWAGFAPIGNMRPVYSRWDPTLLIVCFGLSLGLIIAGRWLLHVKK